MYCGCFTSPLLYIVSQTEAGDAENDGGTDQESQGRGQLQFTFIKLSC